MSRDEMSDGSEMGMHESVSFTLADRINRACDRFESDWRAGGRPRIEDQLDSVTGPERATLARELLAVELHWRRRAGERPTAAEYLERFPEDAEAVHDAYGRAETADVARTPSTYRSAREDTDVPPPGTDDRSGDGLPAPEDRIRYFDDYELIRVLGGGGMGVVYKARQISLNRPVALKMIRSAALASEDELRRFQNEAEAVARLDHPHIVPIYEVGTHEGRPYFSMRLIAGESLDRRPTAYRDDPGAAARLVVTTAEAVHHAHQRGILHRDLKPANIVLDDNGQPHVTDFGLAKHVEGDSELTQSGAVIGTPGYMAPEQATGRRGAVTTATDVYGLGAILYALLTGRAPFLDDSVVAVLQRVRDQAPEPLRKLNAQVPRDLETICLRAMAKDPRDRFSSAAEMADELRRFLEGRTIRSRRVPSYERLWRWCKRNPWLAGAGATTVALTILVAFLSTIAAYTYREQRDALTVQQGKTQQNLEWAVKAERGMRLQLERTQKAEQAARLALGKSLLAEGAAAQRSGLNGQRFDSLERLTRSAELLRADPEGCKLLPKVRQHAIAAMTLTDLRPVWAREIGDSLVSSFDHDFQRYAVVEARTRDLVVRHIDDDRELFRLPKHGTDDQYTNVSFNAAGDLFLVDYRGQNGRHVCQVWHVEHRELVLHREGRWSGIAPHPDGRQLVFWFSPERTLQFWDIFRNREIRRLTPDARDLAGPYLDADGKRIAFLARETITPLVKLYELETGRPIASWDSRVGRDTLAWSADGRLLAMCDPDRVAYIWDVPGHRLVSVLRGHSLSVLSAQFARQGALLATESWDGTTRLWDAIAGDSMVAAPGFFRQFSRDGRRIALKQGTTIGVWEVAAGRECRTLHPELIGNATEQPPQRLSELVYAAGFSPDGRLVATSGLHRISLWDAANGRELAHFDAGLTGSFLFHPDGGSLIIFGERGLHRWPVSPDPSGAGVLRLGPPELLRDPDQTFNMLPAAWLPGHRALAYLDNAEARVLVHDLDDPGPAPDLSRAFSAGRNHRMTSLAVSPDGRWMAAGGWKEAGICVWDVPAARLVRVLRPPRIIGDWHTKVAFTPDGRRLIAASRVDERSGYDTWTVGTWDQGPSLAAEWPCGFEAPLFTSDGRMMAAAIGPREILLAEAETGREITRLSTLNALDPAPLAFSPDGTKLIAQTNQMTALIWDLRLIRDQLAAMRLDWDWPPFAPASAQQGTSGPPSIQIQGAIPDQAARRAAERAELDRRVAHDPDDPDALTRRGWLSMAARQWPEAIADLRWAARRRPRDVLILRLLAAALIEVPGRARDAVDVLSRLLEVKPGDPHALRERGRLWLAVGDARMADADLAARLAMFPDDLDAIYTRVRARHHLGRYRETLADLDRLIQDSPRTAIYYQLRGQAQEAEGNAGAARDDFRRAREILPPMPTALNDAAWDCVAQPESMRDPERAHLLIRRAVELEPSNNTFLNTLGVVLYRLGRDDEAITALEKSLRLGNGQFDAFDLFFLAMAHARLGHTAEAGDCYDRAVRWWDGHKKLPAPYVRELASFRAEAEVILGSPALPSDPFAPGPSQ
jgi:serine/threonine-protein kinase